MKKAANNRGMALGMAVSSIALIFFLCFIISLVVFSTNEVYRISNNHFERRRYVDSIGEEALKELNNSLGSGEVNFLDTYSYNDNDMEIIYRANLIKVEEEYELTVLKEDDIQLTCRFRLVDGKYKIVKWTY